MPNMDPMNVQERSGSVLVVLTTGRPSYRKAINTLAHNIALWRPAVARVDLLVSFDVSPHNVSAISFMEPPPEPLAPGGTVDFAGPEFVQCAQWLDEDHRERLAQISPSTGFGQKKNACLYYAMRHAYDHVIFWDDDEYAIHLEHDGQLARWATTNIVSAHALADADVTFGFWTGYVSPIPDSFFSRLDNAARQILTQALGPITDVVGEDTFFVREATFCMTAAPTHAEEIAMTRGGKWVSGGNLGVRCGAIRQGRIPAFYTPKDSRGDDSVFSTGLAHARVMQVPAGIFHDAFGTFEHKEITVGTTGGEIPPAASTTRFANVLRGWLAYAPALTILRGAADATALLAASSKCLEKCDAELIRYFGQNWRWKPPSVLLREYVDDVGQELDRYEQFQSLWRELCEPWSQ